MFFGYVYDNICQVNVFVLHGSTSESNVNCLQRISSLHGFKELFPIGF